MRIGKWIGAAAVLAIGVVMAADRPALEPSPVRYTSFRQEQFDLHAWKGEKVVFLTREADLDASAMQRLCDTFDKVYDFFHMATGREPRGLQHTVIDGRTTIAQVDNTCGAGCGYLGAKGIELMTGAWNELYNGVKDNNQYDQVLFYEFGRNFWFFENKLEYKGDDRTGSVTTGYAVYMRFVAVEHLGLEGGPFRGRTWAQFRDEVEKMVDRYVADKSLTWENTMKIGQAPRNPMGLNATDLFAGFCLKLSNEHGGTEYVKRFFSEVNKRPRAQSTQDAVDNFIVAASIAAGKDLSEMFTKEWRWPLSDAARQHIAQTLAKK